ncbi:hypothetical protein N6L26_09300 [Qipengyuania sp. SS22]|uniref:hypothetical protein n=1 Tax=Qipengyuania sp. SS22 TaxID=2979461 RepID=UPI0021E5472E|nr:hypothetical protein [Qipengyuania sp. SS22]UYH54249.1 hypothetical protein N6L26_09300 [Qipengyuania sp. SS22]
MLFVAFLFAAYSGAVQWLSGILRIIPAPTEHWATIIGDVAWPIMIAWLVVRFRQSLRRIIEILIIRFKRDDIDIGNVLKVTRNSTLVPLQADSDDASSDASVTERLLEYISDSANVPIVAAWLNQQGRDALDLREFITLTEYADLRQHAYQQLIEGGA